MKKLFALILICILTSSLCASTFAAAPANQITRLSELSEEACIAFIKAKGLEIPEELSDYSSLGAFVKNIIVTVENNPYHRFTINYSVAYNFANQIKNVVNQHYNISYTPEVTAFASTSEYSLQYNTVHGNWLNEYLGYNCHSYALGQTRPYDGVYKPTNPGDFNPKTKGTYNADTPVKQIADLTVSDLTYLNYSCVKYDISYSNIVNMSNTHNIICLRKCTEVGKEDFHYMKLSGSAWLHKPGNTHVLSFKYLPYAINWRNEYSYMGTVGDGDRYYTGTIYYFAFREFHSLTSVYNNYHCHLGDYHYFEYATTCRYCGEVTEVTLNRVECSGPPCSVPDLASISPEDFGT